MFFFTGKTAPHYDIQHTVTAPHLFIHVCCNHSGRKLSRFSQFRIHSDLLWKAGFSLYNNCGAPLLPVASKVMCLYPWYFEVYVHNCKSTGASDYRNGAGPNQKRKKKDLVPENVLGRSPTVHSTLALDININNIFFCSLANSNQF